MSKKDKITNKQSENEIFHDNHDDLQVNETMNATKADAPTDSQEVLTDMDYQEIIQPVKPTKAFVKSADKYEDLHSSAVTLLIVGILGIVFLVCVKLNIISIDFDAVMEYVFYIVMGSLFCMFIIVGLFTLRSASKVKKNIADEEAFDKQLLRFALETLNSETIDTAIASGSIYFADEDTDLSELAEKLSQESNASDTEEQINSDNADNDILDTDNDILDTDNEFYDENYDEADEQMNYFKRVAYIRQALVDEFGEMNESYLDEMVEQIYQTLYEDNL